MSGDSFLALMCASLIGLLFGLAMNLAGYRLFLILLPIWGFFFGFGFGAQTMQAIFGTGALSTLTSWVVGFLVGALFAVLAYLFYIFAVAIIAGSLGYGLVVGLLTAIGLDMGLIVWLLGLAGAVALAIVVLRFNVAKWVIIIATAAAGAGVIIGVFLGAFSGAPVMQLVQNPVRVAISNSPFWMIMWLILAVIGIVAQFASTRYFKVEQYNRWDSMSSESPAAT